MTIENQQDTERNTPFSKRLKTNEAQDEQNNMIKDEQEPRHQNGLPIASLSGSTMVHQAIISPIHMANLPLNILEQLQQHHGNTTVITSIPHNAVTITPNILDYHPITPPSTVQTNNTSTTTTKSTTANNKKSDDKSKGLTADERRQRRLLRNRLAAKDCRKKKKEYIKQMEDNIARLESENLDLNNQIKDLKDQIASLPQEQQLMINNEDNYKLMKEVEELNAKLGNIK